MKKQLIFSVFILTLSLVAKAMGWTQDPKAQMWFRAILCVDYDYRGALREAGKFFQGSTEGWQSLPPSEEELPGIVRPVMGKVSSEFGIRQHPVLGDRRHHSGVDFEAPLGSPILAALPGVVEEVGSDPSYGLKIILKHEDDWQTLYAHCQEALVKPGDEVKAGQVIGRVGDSGLTTGAHLHFELLIRGEAVDPGQLIK